MSLRKLGETFQESWQVNTGFWKTAGSFLAHCLSSPWKLEKVIVQGMNETRKSKANVTGSRKKKKLKKKNEANLDSEFQEKMQGRSLPAIFF